jgi:hypothetical protein
MGHGASALSNSIPISNSIHFLNEFKQIENYCKNNYYNYNLLEYQNIIENCIKYEKLDFLEILIVGGPIKKIFPVHIACQYGK